MLHDRIVKLHTGGEVRTNADAGVHTPREYTDTQNGHPLGAMLEPDLSWMKIEVPLAGQPLADEGDNGREELATLVRDDKVIDVTPVVTQAKLMLAEMIEAVQIEVGENLGGQVAYGQALVGRHAEEAFVGRKVIPEFGRTPSVAAEQGVVQDEGAAERQEVFPVGMVVHAREKIFEEPCEKRAANMHEKAADVELEHPGVTRIVGGALAYEALDPLNAEVGTFADAAGIAVVNEGLFEIWIEAVDEDMVHDTVAESRREYLAFDWLFDNEDRRRAWLPGS